MFVFLTVLIKYKIRLFMVDLIRYALISHTLTALGTEVVPKIGLCSSDNNSTQNTHSSSLMFVLRVFLAICVCFHYFLKRN